MNSVTTIFEHCTRLHSQCIRPEKVNILEEKKKPVINCKYLTFKNLRKLTEKQVALIKWCNDIARLQTDNTKSISSPILAITSKNIKSILKTQDWPPEQNTEKCMLYEN